MIPVGRIAIASPTATAGRGAALGIADAREETSLRSQSVASPVVDASGSTVAALAVVLQSGRGDVRRLGPAVRTTAISTSRALRERANPGGPLPLRLLADPLAPPSGAR
jgi:DNA-binding IclR family transcriptional regulator